MTNHTPKPPALAAGEIRSRNRPGKRRRIALRMACEIDPTTAPIEAFSPWLFWSTRQDETVELRIERGWLVPRVSGSAS